MRSRNCSLIVAALGAVAALGVLAARRPQAAAEDATQATAGPAPTAQATQVNLLYTVNNLGYTSTCG